MDRTFLRTLDEIGTASPTAKVIEAVEKELGNNNRIAHKNFFLYDNANMAAETYVSKLNRNISSYGVISFLGRQVDLNNKLHLIKN